MSQRFDGGVIELDCLRIVHNLVANNALTCKVLLDDFGAPSLYGFNDNNHDCWRRPSPRGAPRIAGHDDDDPARQFVDEVERSNALADKQTQTVIFPLWPFQIQKRMVLWTWRSRQQKMSMRMSF